MADMGKADIPKSASGIADPSCVLAGVYEWCLWIALGLPCTSCKDNGTLSASSDPLQPLPVPRVLGGGDPLPNWNPWYLLVSF